MSKSTKGNTLPSIYQLNRYLSYPSPFPLLVLYSAPGSPGSRGRGHLDGPQGTQITNSPAPHSQEVEDTHALCDILQVAELGGPEGPWPDS